MKRKACSIAANAMTSFVLYYILLLTTWSKAITAQESSNAKNGVTIMASSKEYLHFILEQLSALELMPAAICDLPYEGGCYEHLCPILTFG